MPAEIEPVLLTCVRIETMKDDQKLTNASGFFFEREGRLYVVTSQHVVTDLPSGHAPDSLGLVVHSDPNNLAATTIVRMPLIEDGTTRWHALSDAGGSVDVAVVPIDRSLMPSDAHFKAFNMEHLCSSPDEAEVGDPTIIVGFPLGFHDALHALPVARSSMIASSFGFRFQGQGYFLTDGRLHRGASGSPVLKRNDAASGPGHAIPWKLLGVHSARLDVGDRDLSSDEALGLNVAWYADVVEKLTTA